MPDKGPCPRCGRLGFIRFEHIIKGDTAIRLFYCGSCQHSWEVRETTPGTSAPHPDSKP